MGLAVEKRRKGREREEFRSIEAMIEVLSGDGEGIERWNCVVRSTLLFAGMWGSVAEDSMGRMPCLSSVSSLARGMIKCFDNNQT